MSTVMRGLFKNPSRPVPMLAAPASAGADSVSAAGSAAVEHPALGFVLHPVQGADLFLQKFKVRCQSTSIAFRPHSRWSLASSSQPDVVIVFDPDLGFMRQLEVTHSTERS
jgi:hypothetical protein